MGAERYEERVMRKDAATVAEAFEKARDHAYYEYGHRGYTGSLAEKGRCAEPIAGPFASWEEAERFVEDTWDGNSANGKQHDKWGPSEVVEVSGPDGGWCFFGWASS